MGSMRNTIKYLSHVGFATLLALLTHMVAPCALASGAVKKVTKVSEDHEEAKALKTEMFIAAQEEKALQQINKLLKKYKNTQLEPDLLMRMAELYMRRAKTDRFLELNHISEDRVSVLPKAIKSSNSKKQVFNAIDIFDQIERRYPNFEKIDAVIFNNAFANQQVGNDSKSEKLYKKLVASFSDSQFLPDAYLAVGEIEFRNGKFKEALAHFTAIRNYPDSMVFPYGIYKAAWTYYNLRDAKLALKNLEDVVQYGKFVQQQGIDSRLDLRREALVDMALFYEDINQPGEAYSYFKNQAGDLDVAPVLVRLANLYKRHGRNQDIIVVLTELIRKKANSAYVPTAYIEVADASEKLKKKKDVITLLEEFYKICQIGSSWATAQGDLAITDKDSPLLELVDSSDKLTSAQAICQNTFHRVNLSYANRWLKTWQKDIKQDELANLVESAFDLYLKSDGKSQESSRTRFVYADFLFKREKYRSASEHYEISSQISNDVLIGPDASYYSLLSLEKAVKNTWSEKDEMKFRNLSSVYLMKYPKDKHRLDVEFELGFIFYQKGKYDEAAPLFLRLGEQYSTLDKGIKSQDLYLDILNIKKDFSTLKNYTYTLKSKADPIRSAKLTKIYEESYFYIIQDLEKANSFKQAVEEYHAFAKINPNSPLTQKANWNATQLLYKMNEPILAAEASNAYYNQYKSAPESLDILIKSAQTYESLAMLSEAAKTLEKISEADKLKKSKWNMMAADFYMIANQTTKAQAIYENLKTNKSDKEAYFHILMQLEQIAGHNKSNLKYYEDLLTEISNTGHEPEATHADLYFVKNAFQNKSYTETFSLSKKIMAKKDNGVSKIDLAECRLIQARILNKEFIDQSVKSKIERIQAVLTLKTQKLSAAQIAFQSAANYGDSGVAIEAYRELADSYLHYSEALRNMPLPAGVPNEEADAFRQEMDKLAIPMEEKGIDAKVQSYKLAVTYKPLDPITYELKNELKKLNQSVARDAKNAFIVQQPSFVLPQLKKAGT